MVNIFVSLISLRLGAKRNLTNDLTQKLDPYILLYQCNVLQLKD